MKTKLFFEQLASLSYRYGYDRYCVEMGVLNFESEEEARAYVTKFRTENPINPRRFFIISYKNGTTIGKLSRHINQCFGSSQWSFERDVKLVSQMYGYIRQFCFEELEPQDHSEMNTKLNHAGVEPIIHRYWFNSKKVSA